jgi:histone H3/H4
MPSRTSSKISHATFKRFALRNAELAHMSPEVDAVAQGYVEMRTNAIASAAYRYAMHAGNKTITDADVKSALEMLGVCVYGGRVRPPRKAKAAAAAPVPPPAVAAAAPAVVV